MFVEKCLDSELSEAIARKFYCFRGKEGIEETSFSFL